MTMANTNVQHHVHKKGESLTYYDRLQIEKYLNQGIAKDKIAKQLNTCLATIYNEIHRGRYKALTTDLVKEYRYSADLAEMRYQEGLRVRGTELKIGYDHEYADRLEYLIYVKKYSPQAALDLLHKTGEENKYKTKIKSCHTIYSYIRKGVFRNLTMSDLPHHGKRRKGHVQRKQQKRDSAGTSIEERSPEIMYRKEFGHWEMDSVVGGKKGGKDALVVLTERKTRMEFIFKVPSHEAKHVVAVLDKLERKHKNMFPKIFKTITVDNGSEFSNCKDMERSVFKCRKKRTTIFYCHAYCSWERGSNENLNRMIRRHYPKGTDFSKISDKEIQFVQDWMNDYPRPIFGALSAREVYNIEIQKLE